MNPTVRWIAVAAAGVALAVALAFVSYQLINEPVGLSSEPTSAGDSLAPTAVVGSTAPIGDGDGPTKKSGGAKDDSTGSNTGGSGGSGSGGSGARAGSGGAGSGGDDGGGDDRSDDSNGGRDDDSHKDDSGNDDGDHDGDDD